MLGSGSVAVSVSSNLYVFAAFGAGVISFVSPCVLPIVPGYLSLVTGLSVTELEKTALTQILDDALAPAATIVAITSDAAVEPYAGWGGYGASNAAL